MRRRYWVGAADVIYWQITAARLRGGLHDWIAAQRAQGWEVEAGAFSTRGWPQAAIVTVPNLTLRHRGPEVPGNLSWASAGVSVSVSLHHPTELDITPSGPQHIRIGEAPEAIVTGDQIRLSVGPLQEDRLSLALYARALQVEPAAGGWHLTVGLLNAQAQVVPAAGQSEPAVAYSVNTEAIALPATARWPLGPNISSLSAEGALNGPLPPVRNITRWAEAWRDGGGSLDISHLALGWGTLGLTSTATLALDDRLQPMGSGSARLVGYAETLDLFAASGLLSRSAATAAKAILSLIAGTGDSDQPSAVDVPLTLQYRTLSMRQVPLVRLPELDWPNR